MKKLKTKSGYIVYEVTAEELYKYMDSPGICDFCDNPSREGYLIPVINRFYCPKCFVEFNSNSTYYPTDIPVETKNAAYYESLIPLDNNEEVEQ